MLRRGIVKCLSLFFFVFLMCPRRIRPTAIGKQNYFHARRNSDLDELNLGPQPYPNDEVMTQDFVDNEPGFDLTDVEIRKFKLWTNGIIPYYIDAVSFNDKVIRDRIRFYLHSVNVQTRINFLELPSPPKDDNSRWVFFANRRGQLDCADHSILHFTNEGVQHVNLGYDCLSTGGELAEAVLAIAGVPPQHNAPNRDEFVTIVEKNIMPGKRHLFRKLNDSDWLFHDMAYDITSASHYQQHKYSINGQATIDIKAEMFESSDSYNKMKTMGERHGLSRDDIVKLRMLYNYVVKKNKNKVPECDKLFRKGHNFLNQRPINVPVVEPRKKPNKYLGLPEETNELNEDSNSEKSSEYDQVNEDENGDDNGDKQGFNLAEIAGVEVNFANEDDNFETFNAGADNGDNNGDDNGDDNGDKQGFKLEEYGGVEVNFANEGKDKMNRKSHPNKLKHK